MNLGIQKPLAPTKTREQLLKEADYQLERAEALMARIRERQVLRLAMAGRQN